MIHPSSRFPAVASLILLILSGCTLTVPGRDREIHLLTYNVQNLFDDHANGNEYEEFDPNRSSWSTAEYHSRLQDISRVIRDSVRGGPDIIAFQEIERLSVLGDLQNRYLGGLGYTHVCATEPESSPIVVGLISRYPILEANSHGARIDDKGRVRPMLEALIDVRGSRIRVFVCHWKSKSGGAEATEPYRIAAAAALRNVVSERLAEDPMEDVIIVGDLNEQLDESRNVRFAYPTALNIADDVRSYSDVRGIVVDRLPGGEGAQPGLFYSPWFTSTCSGSYRFRGVWERIDHVLLTAGCFDERGAIYADFTVVTPGYTTEPDGTPLGYSERTGTGFSDHLPLLLTLRIAR